MTQNKTRWLGTILFFIGVVISLYAGKKYLQLEQSSPSQRLQILWDQDVATLIKKNKIHRGWYNLKEVIVIPTSPQTREMIKNLTPPVKTSARGQYKLEILILNWEEGKTHGIIIQYNLVHIKSQNMVWELSRNFIIKS
ncbi:MAG: hypothetical protein K1X29_06545 [Bdellovibrionales bacterium]|nr:hypothetical protein [Bdellovibrionales bacterium]